MKMFSQILILCSALALFSSGCTVHHHHVHEVGCDCDGRGSHGMKGHGMKGHGMKGHGMKGHGMKGHGHGHGAFQCTGHGPGEGHGHGLGPEHHAELSPELRAMHDAFAKVWHVKPASERPAKACPVAVQLAHRAKEVRGADKPPKVDAAAWDKATGELLRKMDAISSACESKGDVGKAMQAAHDAMHAVFVLFHGTK
jgi:hypothetical protein